MAGAYNRCQSVDSVRVSKINETSLFVSPLSAGYLSRVSDIKSDSLLVVSTDVEAPAGPLW